MPRFLFRAAGLDRWDRRTSHPVDGTLVVKTQPFGCPPNGTMGHCFIADAADPGIFYGLCLLTSLERVADGRLERCKVCRKESATLLRMTPQGPWTPYCDACADLIAGLGPDTTPLPPGFEPRYEPAPGSGKRQG